MAQSGGNHSVAGSAESYVDIALIASDRPTGDPQSENTIKRIKQLLVQDTACTHFEIHSPHEFFQALRRIGAGGRKIRRLIIAAHGNDDHVLGFDDPLTDDHINRRLISEKKAIALDQLSRMEGTIELLEKTLANAKTDKDRKAVDRYLTGERGRAELARQEVALWNTRETDLLGVRDVMMDDASIMLINCRAASEPGGKTFLKRLGEPLLNKGGGTIAGATGDVWIRMIGEEFLHDLPVIGNTPVTNFFEALAMQVQIMVSSKEPGEVYIAPAEWVCHSFQKSTEPGFPVGRLLVSGDVFINPAGAGQQAGVKSVRSLLLSGGGAFNKPMHWGPVGSTGEVPAPYEFGGVAIPQRGTVRYWIRVDKPFPVRWKGSNSNARVNVVFSFADNSRSYGGSSNWLGEETNGEIPVRGRCMMNVIVEPPGGAGIFGGEYGVQSFSLMMDFIPEGEAPAATPGMFIGHGNRISTSSGRAIVRFNDGTRVLLRENSEIEVEAVPEGGSRVTILNGGVFVFTSKSSENKLRYKLKKWTVTPQGTSIDFDGDWQRITVYEGHGVVEGDGLTLDLAANQSLDITSGNIGPPDSPDPDWEKVSFCDQPLQGLPLDLEARPYGATQSGSDPLDGWLLDNPLDDPWSDPWHEKTHYCSCKAGQSGEINLKISGDTNRLERQPRLRRLVSGDFCLTLDATINLTAPAEQSDLFVDENAAWFGFFVYEPFSGLGLSSLASASIIDGLMTDCLLLGGVSVTSDGAFVQRDPWEHSRSQEARAGVEQPLRLRLVRFGTDLTVAWKAKASEWTVLETIRIPELAETIWAGLYLGCLCADSLAEEATVNLTRIDRWDIVSMRRGTLPDLCNQESQWPAEIAALVEKYGEPLANAAPLE